MYGKHIYSLHDTKVIKLQRFIGHRETENSIKTLILREGTSHVIEFREVMVSSILKFLDVAIQPEAHGSFCQDKDEVLVALKYLHPDVKALYLLSKGLRKPNDNKYLDYITKALTGENNAKSI